MCFKNKLLTFVTSVKQKNSLASCKEITYQSQNNVIMIYQEQHIESYITEQDQCFDTEQFVEDFSFGFDQRKREVDPYLT